MLHVAVLLSGHVTCCLKPVITILRTHPYMSLRCEPVLWGGWTSILWGGCGKHVLSRHCDKANHESGGGFKGCQNEVEVKSK